MRADAEENSAADKERRELVELKNNGDQMIYGLEKTLKENEAKVEDDAKAEVEAKIKVLREKLEGEDVAAIQAALADLEASAQKIGQALYAQAQQEGATEADAPEEGSQEGAGAGAGVDEDIKDADFEVK